MRLPDRHAFNTAILSLAPAHVARGRAPGTYAELQHAATLGGPMTVWDGASGQTIFGDARVNHAFRAWHDAAHITGGYDFTLAGEIDAMLAQQRQLAIAFPSAPAWAYRLIQIEVEGQARYFAAHGHFPLDQIAFTLGALHVQG